MQLASLATLGFCAFAVVWGRHSGPAQPLAEFNKSLAARDLPRSIAICEKELLPPGSNINVSYIRSLLDDYPDSINLLACIFQKGVVSMPSDGGAELLFVAASKQHVRLAVAVLSLGSPLERPHVDTASGAGVFHAALLNRMLTLDIVHRTLVAQGSDSEANRPSPRNSTVAWLEVKGEAVARHLSPASAADAVRGAVASLVTVASGSRSGIVSGPGSGADLRAARAHDAQLIANGLSFLLVRILLDSLAKQSSSAARQGAYAGHAARAIQVDGAIEEADLRHSRYAAPYQELCAAASAWRLLQTIEQSDHYGRTPLHAAAATGNVAAIRALVEAHYMLFTRAITALATTPRHWCQVPSVNADNNSCCMDIEAAAADLQDEGPASATRMHLARFVGKRDARGFTPIDAACHAGYDDAAAALEAAKMTTKGSPAPERQVDAAAPPWLLQSVPSWAEAYARHGWQRSKLCAIVIDSEPPALHSTPPPLGAPPSESVFSVPDVELLADGGWTTPRYVPVQAAEAVAAVLAREKFQWPGVSVGDGGNGGSGDGHAGLFSGASVATTDALLCDFDVVDGTASPGISAAAFQARYQARGLPVLLRGLGARWPLRSAWTRSGLVDGSAGAAAFGNVGRVPYAAAFGASPASLISEVTLAAFVESLLSGGGEPQQQQPSCREDEACAQTGAAPAPLYVFDSPASPASRRAALTIDAQQGNNSLAGAAALMAPLELTPPFLRGDVLLLLDEAAWRELLHGAKSPDDSGDPLVRPSPAPKPQVFVGGPGSGAPLHYHTDAWNVVAWGRKHWWLLPPSAGAYSSEPAAAWAKHSEAAFARLGVNGAPFECVQQAGDVLFVPAGWAHAVLNTGENVTVGAAVELTLGYPGPAGWVRLH